MAVRELENQILLPDEANKDLEEIKLLAANGYDVNNKLSKVLDSLDKIGVLIETVADEIKEALKEIKKHKEKADKTRELSALAQQAEDKFNDFFQHLRLKTKEFSKYPVNSTAMRVDNESEFIESMISAWDMNTLLGYWHWCQQGTSKTRTDVNYYNSKVYRFTDIGGRSIELVVIKEDGGGYLKDLRNCSVANEDFSMGKTA